MRKENRIPGESNCFQVNKGVKAVYKDVRKKLESLSINSKTVSKKDKYTICLQEYHYKNAIKSLGLPTEALTKLSDAKVITTSAQDVLEEYFSSHQHINSHIEGRLIYK